MIHHRDPVVGGLKDRPEPDLRCGKRAFGVPSVRYVAEEPDSSQVTATACTQGGGMTVYDPVVTRLQFIVRGFLKMSVKVPDARDVCLRILDQRRKHGQRACAISSGDLIGGQSPHLQESSVDRDDPHVGVDHQDSVGRRLHLRHQQSVGELQFFRGRLALSHVDHHARHFHQLPAFVAPQLVSIFDPSVDAARVGDTKFHRARGSAGARRHDRRFGGLAIVGMDVRDVQLGIGDQFRSVLSEQ
jgi:hypothetical protein